MQGERAYSEEISVTNGTPACVAFLVDQSASMRNRIRGGSGAAKSEFVAEAVNSALENLITRCTKENEVEPYFHTQLVGYGYNIDEVSVVLEAPKGEFFLPIDQVETWVDEHRLREDGVLRLLKPVAVGRTPMARAFLVVEDPIRDWMARFPRSFPPIVINITDGYPDPDTDEHFEAVRSTCRRIRSLQNRNGSHVLIFNLHVGEDEFVEPCVFCGEDALPKTGRVRVDRAARLLFECASELPEQLAQAARQKSIPVGANQPRCYGYDLGASDLISVLQIGTRADATGGEAGTTVWVAHEEGSGTVPVPRAAHAAGPAEEDTVPCPSCKEPVNAADAHCSSCGAPLSLLQS